MKITILLPNKEQKILSFDRRISVEAIFNYVKEYYQYPIYLSKLNNTYRSLTHIAYHDCQIEFLDISDNWAWYCYQNSLILLMSKALHDLYHDEIKINVKNSFNKGLYILTNKSLNEIEVNQIKDKMQELVKKDIKISKEHFDINEAISLAKDLNQEDTVRLLESKKDLNNVEIYTLDDETRIFYGFIVPSTGYLKEFDLVGYQKGLLLRYPHQKDPTCIPEYQDQTLLYNAFKEANKWGDTLGIHYVADLNKTIQDGKYEEMFLLQDALHAQKIADIAVDIKEKKKRVVLICGPSSSGKTTFAKRMCIQLKVNGLTPLYIGTDDYYREESEAAYDENGKRDYESIKAINSELFVTNLKDLLVGKQVDLPIYDFTIHKRIFGKRITKIEKDGVIVIEGIHALNDILTEGVDDNDKYKIYISPFSPLAVDQYNRISTTDCRLLRRIVRDNQFRGWNSKSTIAQWPAVRKGEEENIFPYANKADVFFNSNCVYELAVLKKYSEPLLNEIQRDEEEYAQAQSLLAFLRFFEEIENDNLIANNSIIREFIGGSCIVK